MTDAQTMMILVTNPASDTLEVAYNRAVLAGDFSETEFTAKPSNNVGFSVSQVNGNTLSVAFASDVDTDTALAYDGVAGTMSPQTIEITR